MSDKPIHDQENEKDEDASARLRSCISEDRHNEFDEHIFKFSDNNGKNVVKDQTTSKFGDVTTSIDFYAGAQHFRSTDSHDLNKPIHILEVYRADNKIHNASKLEARHAIPVLNDIENYFKNGYRCEK